MRESLLAAGVLEVIDPPDADGRTVRIVDELQVDFALNQPLSTFALAAIELLDRESETYALDVLSVLESTLEDPRQVLFAQQFRARGEAVAAMKAEGIEYEERMELLEEVTWPKPLADLLEAAYDIYAEGHPWVTEYPLRPKSVARELSELAMTFVEFVGYHKLAASEGLVLRYLADAYKALKRTVPDEARTEELADLTEWLGELVRQVDSSLLDEWERLLHPEDADMAAVGRRSVDAGPPPVTANVRAFRVLVRNALFRRVELAALRRWDDLGELDAEAGWDADRWRAAMEEYYAQHEYLGHRASVPRAAAAADRGAARAVDRSAGVRRPGRRPRLGDQRGGRPRGQRRRGNGSRAGDVGGLLLSRCQAVPDTASACREAAQIHLRDLLHAPRAEQPRAVGGHLGKGARVDPAVLHDLGRVGVHATRQRGHEHRAHLVLPDARRVDGLVAEVREHRRDRSGPGAELLGQTAFDRVLEGARRAGDAHSRRWSTHPATSAS